MKNWKDKVDMNGFCRAAGPVEVQEARIHGMKVHKVFRGGRGDDGYDNAYDYYIATPEFVKSYHQSGGSWSYED